ncbi:MAG: hypothetical protein U9R02_15095, partial [Thermodesulfobacteriota bacterium]|nr:hypothetical protein [Thermodesulfobacteriota bacterium]
SREDRRENSNLVTDKVAVHSLKLEIRKNSTRAAQALAPRESMKAKFLCLCGALRQAISIF